MATNIQVRAVDDDLARAAKARAEATHRTLSAYIRDLIERDLAAHDAQSEMSRLLHEIRADGPRHVSRDDTAAALAQVRSELAAQ